MADVEHNQLRAEAEAHLRALVARDDAALRDDQWEAIAALVEQQRRALVVQRTGWGKSAIYFVATALLRARQSGPTVIISPLLALMRNQIAAAERAGINAVTINSTNPDDWASIEAQVGAGDVDVLLVSPERLNNPQFRDEILPSLSATAGLLVIDEAHCISDWGHDFRPDYRRIRQALHDLPAGIPVLATTATANARVTEDVAEQLAAGDVDVLVLRGSLDRETLRLGVVPLPAPEQRLAWLASHLDDWDGSGIIYCLTVGATHQVAEFLSEHGHHVAAYSGQTEPTERLHLEQDLLDGRLKALVATSALGMGFDATLGFVVNLGAPQSPVAYYQQVGRAGRGTDDAVALLLPGREDRDIWAYFASLAFPSEQVVRATLDVLSEHGKLSTVALETYVDLSRTRLETMLKVLDVDGAVRRVKGGWEATGEEWAYDAARYARVAESRAREQDLMLDYLSTNSCRMRFLRETLDDPEAQDCGRCDNCGGLDLDLGVNEAFADQAKSQLGRPGEVLQARKIWPTGLDRLGLPWKGRITGADPGRTVAKVTDLSFGASLRALFRPEANPATVPDDLARAMVTVLQDWEPEVDVIVRMDSQRRPQLLADLAEGLSRFLQLPVVGSIDIVDSGVAPDQGATNSAQRVAAVVRRFGLTPDGLHPDLAEQIRGKSVLLIDDQVGTGWTLTLAAACLRRAGATTVYPLALASS